MSGRLERRIDKLARRVGPPMPRCELCGAVGGGAIRTLIHKRDGRITDTRGREVEPPCPGCARISRAVGRPSAIVICETYARGTEGEVCPICGEGSVASIRAKMGSGELSPSAIPPMIQMGRGRV